MACHDKARSPILLHDEFCAQVKVKEACLLLFPFQTYIRHNQLISSGLEGAVTATRLTHKYFARSTTSFSPPLHFLTSPSWAATIAQDGKHSKEPVRLRIALHSRSQEPKRVCHSYPAFSFVLAHIYSMRPEHSPLSITVSSKSFPESSRPLEFSRSFPESSRATSEMSFLCLFAVGTQR
jgi:hypothetical protein